MTSPLWLKLWIDLLDDTKVAKMSDWLFRQFVYLLLAAKEYDKDGLLPTELDLAWRLRMSKETVHKSLVDLATFGVVCYDLDAGAWLIVNFKKRQAVSDSVDRMRRMRARRKEQEVLRGDVTLSSSTSSSLLNKNLYLTYEQEIGALTPQIADCLKAAEEDYPAEWIDQAIKEAALHNARSWKYVEAVLKNWKVKGFQARKGGKDGAPKDYTAGLPDYSEDEEADAPTLSPAPEFAKTWTSFRDTIPKSTQVYAEQVAPMRAENGSIVFVATTSQVAEWCTSRWKAVLETQFMHPVIFEVEGS